jgi:hypothetical protein
MNYTSYVYFYIVYALAIKTKYKKCWMYPIHIGVKRMKKKMKCLLLFLTCTTMFNYTDIVPKQQSYLYLYNINQQQANFLN